MERKWIRINKKGEGFTSIIILLVLVALIVFFVSSSQPKDTNQYSLENLKANYTIEQIDGGSGGQIIFNKEEESNYLPIRVLVRSDKEVKSQNLVFTIENTDNSYLIWASYPNSGLIKGINIFEIQMPSTDENYRVNGYDKLEEGDYEITLFLGTQLSEVSGETFITNKRFSVKLID